MEDKDIEHFINTADMELVRTYHAYEKAIKSMFVARDKYYQNKNEYLKEYHIKIIEISQKSDIAKSLIDKTAKAECRASEMQLNLSENQYKQKQDVCDVLIHKINVLKKLIDLRTKSGG